MTCLVLALASYMMSKHVKLLRVGKKNAKELTTGSVDPAAIADSCKDRLIHCSRSWRSAIAVESAKSSGSTGLSRDMPEGSVLVSRA